MATRPTPPRPLRLPTPPVRRTLAAERHATGDRLTMDRTSTAHVRVYSIRQDGTPPTFALTATLTTNTTTEVQLAGRLRDLELFAETLRAALAEARRVGGR